ncbi:hypothetical protein [Mycolicibacterium neoaurum]|uniref:hypothetical protein n=1 Tax=Mycolicibacterium neoaurum TaxID=1795 RepID=UPI001F4D19B9|nr:hypothetical protein [Mycolicibacterium neoaurum]
MVELHFQGIVYDLDEDQSVADVVNFMDNYTRSQNGSTTLKLADGSFMHVQVGDSPVYTVVSPPGYKPEGLKVSRHAVPGGRDEKDNDPNELIDLLDRRLRDMHSTLEGIEAAVMNIS